MTASPLVQVQYSSDAGVWHETAGGVDASPGDTVSIRIKTATGINKWFLEVFGVDEVTATAPTLTGVSLPTHEVATLGTIVTFVMPAGAGVGRAILIRSLVRFGGYTSVSKIGIFTGSGFRVMAVNQSFEGDLTFGLVPTINQAIRSKEIGLIVTTGGTSAMTPAQENSSTIEVSGTLGSGAIIQCSPFLGAQWTIRNNTTGANTLTIQENPAVGSGVVVAQGKTAILRVNSVGAVERVTSDT